MVAEIERYVNLAVSGQGLAWIQAVLLLAVTGYFLVCAVLLCWTDLKQHRLPDRIVLPMYAVVGFTLLVVLWIDHDIARMRQVAYSTVFLAGVYWLLRLLSRYSIGLGDVKLAGVIGMVCGFFSAANILWATLIAFFTGGAVSLYLVLVKRVLPNRRIAFGPFMLAGALVALFYPVYI